MLVSHVTGDCPKCGAARRFGNVHIIDNRVVQGCMTCNYSTALKLPTVKKKIFYLDQFFFNHAFRARDERFVKAARRIQEIAAQQLLIVPFSSIHEDETHQWRGYEDKNREDLMKFIKVTSGGHKFKPHFDVEETQVITAFRSFLANQSDCFKIEERDGIRGDVHKWDNYYWIDIGGYHVNIENMRASKKYAIEGLVDLFPSWRQSSDSFEQSVALEMHNAAMGYIDSYYKYASRLAGGDFMAIVDSPIISSVMRSLLECFPEATTQEERLKQIAAFFQSSHFSEAPCQWLSTRIFAVLREIVNRGAYKNRKETIIRLSG